MNHFTAWTIRTIGHPRYYVGELNVIVTTPVYATFFLTAAAAAEHINNMQLSNVEVVEVTINVKD